MNDWTNPYSDLQHTLREALNDELRRTNGFVSRQQFLHCAEPGRRDRAVRLINRLFMEHPDGRMEWKPEIVTEQVLLQKLGGSASIRSNEIVVLWARSRHLRLRTSYQYIAPVGKKHQLVSRFSFTAPVFGVDILVRPPVKFSEDRQDGEIRNSLTLGDECVAFVIHGTFENGKLMADGKYMGRLVVGDAFAIPRIASLIPSAAGICEQAMRSHLRRGDARSAVAEALPHLNSFAHAAALAFAN